MSPQELLRILQDEVDARASRIADREGWPCKKGCDGCCRSLAAVPYLSQAEWDLLKEGVDGLPPDVRERVRARIDELEYATRPIVCPLLDPDAGACLVYAHRPIACRTYGFYIEREKGLYCGIIENEQADGRLDGVVWGNAESVERRRRQMGGDKSLVEWFKQDQPVTNAPKRDAGDTPKPAL
jgi:uncharacterized protein